MSVCAWPEVPGELAPRLTPWLITDHSPFTIPFPLPEATTVTAGVRPEYLDWTAEQAGAHGVRVRVVVVENAGASALVHCHVISEGQGTDDQQLLRAVVPVDRAPALGDEGWLGCSAGRVLLFDPETEEAMGENHA